MKKIYFEENARIFSVDETRTNGILCRLPGYLWAVEHSTDTQGIPKEVIDWCENQCEGRWFGWYFFPAPSYHLRQEQWPFESVPVLLFESKEDAFFAQVIWGVGDRLNSIPEDFSQR